jgi:hypothetical protein
MRAHFAAFLDHRDHRGELGAFTSLGHALVVGVDEMLQVQRAGERRRARAYEQHVDLEHLTLFRHRSSSGTISQRRS